MEFSLVIQPDRSLTDRHDARTFRVSGELDETAHADLARRVREIRITPTVRGFLSVSDHHVFVRLQRFLDPRCPREEREAIMRQVVEMLLESEQQSGVSQ